MRKASKKALTTHEIAEYCDVTPRTVVKWIHEGKLSAHRTPGNHSRVKVEDFIRFLQKYNMVIPAGLGQGQGKTRVLVVDDDKGMVRFIKQALLSEKVFDVDTAYDGFEAGKKFITHKPDLVILDIRMPKVDGFEVCRAIREDPDNQNIRILVVSGDDKEDGEKILKLGADDFMAKPFSSEKLKEKVCRLINPDRGERHGQRKE